MEINLKQQPTAQSGMKSNVVRAPAHKYDKTGAIHSSHNFHMCRVDCLFTTLDNAV